MPAGAGSPPQSGGRVLILFTRDLRVHDHPALAEACERADEVVPLFVLDPVLLGRSPNRTRFLMESLVELDHQLSARGAGLVIRRGDPARSALTLARETGCTQIWLTEDVSSYAHARASKLMGSDVQTLLFPGHSIVEPREVAPAGRDHYRVFTPFYRAWSQAPRRAVLPAPRKIAVPGDLDLGPRPDPSTFPSDSPEVVGGGESAARVLLDAYSRSGAKDYADDRNLPARDSTSRLSPYLRFGCVSANEVASRLSDQAELTRQLAWRDFFLQLLGADPGLATQDLRPGPEISASYPDSLEAWKEGRTGLPLVDAGMRQLAREGWMHGRVRMVAGSLLTRRLGIPWGEGLRHFDRLLLDGDVANDAGNWQWVAGTGTDPRRTRVLNPVRQAKRFDPDGSYVRLYVEELAGVPTPLIFAPWRDPELLRDRGYPSPIIEVPDKT